MVIKWDQSGPGLSSHRSTGQCWLKTPAIQRWAVGKPGRLQTAGCKWCQFLLQRDVTAAENWNVSCGAPAGHRGGSHSSLCCPRLYQPPHDPSRHLQYRNQQPQEWQRRFGISSDKLGEITPVHLCSPYHRPPITAPRRSAGTGASVSN